MASLIGVPSERWTLQRAVDALLEAARRAGSPGWIWAAGVLYPSIGLGVAGWESHVIRYFVGATWPVRAPLFLHAGFDEMLLRISPGFVLLPVFFRLMVGLARVSSPTAWDTSSGDRKSPRLAQVWEAGKGLTLGAFGLWLQLGIMMIGAVAVTVVPSMYVIRAFGGFEAQIVGLILMSPILLALLVYTIVIGVLMQLGLHSLIQNRRGVASALQHAWRIARHDPLATTRTVVVDLCLSGSIAVIGLLITLVLPFGGLLVLALSGYAGVARAGYWALAYRELGGLSADDGVPGLAS